MSCEWLPRCSIGRSQKAKQKLRRPSVANLSFVNKSLGFVFSEDGPGGNKTDGEWKHQQPTRLLQNGVQRIERMDAKRIDVGLACTLLSVRAKAMLAMQCLPAQKLL